jgi:hypothetical protein
MANVLELQGYAAVGESGGLSCPQASGHSGASGASGVAPLGYSSPYDKNDTIILPKFIEDIKNFCNQHYFEDIKNNGISETTDKYKNIGKALWDLETFWRISQFNPLTDTAFIWTLGHWLMEDNDLSEKTREEEEVYLIWLLWEIQRKYGSVSEGLFSMIKNDLKEKYEELYHFYKK